MKHLTLIVITILVVWTGIAITLIPSESNNGKTPLVWTTGPNPQRDLQVDGFNRLNPDCKLSIDPANSGVMKVVVQSSAGMGPDLIGHVSVNSMQTYRDAGIIWDITEQAVANGFGLDTLPESVHSLVQLRDPETLEYRQYIYPANMANTIIIYNKDLFDKHGIDYPPEDLTWSKYIEIAKAMTIYDEGSSAIPHIFGGGGVDPLLCIWGHGGAQMNIDGTRCLLGEPAAVNGMVFLHDLYFKHAVEPTATMTAGVSAQGGWGGGFMNWFGEGKCAMFFGSRWMLIQLRRYFSEQRNAGIAIPRMGACLVPRLAGGKRYSRTSVRGVGVNRMSPNRDKALKFLQYLAGEEYSGMINTGADAMPGNKAYITKEHFKNSDWPGEEEINDITIKSLAYARSPVKSLLVDYAVVSRAFKRADSEITSNKSLTRLQIQHIMERAAQEVDEEIARNIERNPKLKRTYELLLKQGAEQVRLMPIKDSEGSL